MSWLARSIANSLRIDDDDDSIPITSPAPAPETAFRSPETDDVEEREREGGGAKRDLSEFKDSLTRQLWGVASFLAPPAESTRSDSPNLHRVAAESSRTDSLDGFESDGVSSVYARISTARSSGDDHSEIGLASRRVSECRDGFDDRDDHDHHRDDHDHHHDDDEDEDEEERWIGEAVGLTEEVLTFAGNIAHHPETWLDFPVEDEEDLDDFPMSESQTRHSQAIEHLAPRLAALRIELCPAHMSAGFFWKVYFVLLHSRLNKQDADLLSTPEIVEARAKWMQELQKRDKKESERYHGGHYYRPSSDLDEDFTPRSLANDVTPRSLPNEHSETFSSWTFASEPTTSSTTAEADSDTEKQFITTDLQFADRSTIDEKQLLETDDKTPLSASMSKRPVWNFDDDDDDNDWPEDDCLGENATVIPVGIDEEVSFSDLEDDDCCIPVKSKPEFMV